MDVTLAVLGLFESVVRGRHTSSQCLVYLRVWSVDVTLAVLGLFESVVCGRHTRSAWFI